VRYARARRAGGAPGEQPSSSVRGLRVLADLNLRSERPLCDHLVVTVQCGFHGIGILVAAEKSTPREDNPDPLVCAKALSGRSRRPSSMTRTSK
jgi:hypothetical protein